MSIEALQNAMLEQEQVDCKVEHRFSDGVYARTLIIEPNIVLVGSKHKTNHLFVVLQGSGVFTDENGDAITYQAPMIMETKAGTKRAIHAYTKTIMTSFHATDEKDVEKIGEEILESEQANILPQWKKKLLEVLH